MGPGDTRVRPRRRRWLARLHDPDADVVFAYVCNRCRAGRWQTDRNRRLLDALATVL